MIMSRSLQGIIHISCLVKHFIMFDFLIYVCNSFKSHDDEHTDLFDNSKTFYINVPIGCIMFDFLIYESTSFKSYDEALTSLMFISNVFKHIKLL